MHLSPSCCIYNNEPNNRKLVHLKSHSEIKMREDIGKKINLQKKIVTNSAKYNERKYRHQVMSMVVVFIVYFSDREDITEKMTHNLMDRG